MRTYGLRRLTVVAAVAALALPLGLNSAGAADHQRPNTPRAATAGPIPGAYISPWGSAEIAISPETLKWMEDEGVTVTAIAPFEMNPDGTGFRMPIGSTAGDHLDSKGRIYYPGGLQLHHEASDKTIKLSPTWIRVMPRPGYSAGVEVNGKKIEDEVQIGDTHYEEVMASARPSPTGFRLEQVPFYFTKEASALIEKHSDAEGPRVGSLLGTLTPEFDYVSTGSDTGPVPTPPSFPGFPG
ncbi:hypothetical protein ACIBKX_37790 [Streptomyces sp. NPDC050658]|uniref:hypothetical protein n=1 Tax=unclassified Streptomyces TaxID=2593676 RepID=UPI0034423930